MVKNFFLVLGLLLACNAPTANHDHNTSDNTESHAHHDKHDHDSKHGSANEHMHQTPVPELIKRFESPERDEYQQPDKVMEYLGDLTDKKVMDIGAGSGYFSVRLAEKGAYVIAADVNDEFQQFIRERIEKQGLSDIETRLIPYDGPGLQDQEVDMVLIINTYHHIEDRTEYFEKVLNGLKESGELVIIDFFDFETPVGPKHHKVSIDTVIDELKKAGFTTFDVEVNLLPYQYVIRGRYME